MSYSDLRSAGESEFEVRWSELSLSCMYIWDLQVELCRRHVGT
jgi:hypothetical protein